MKWKITKKYNNINPTNRPTALFMRINFIFGLSEHLQSAVPSLYHKYWALIYCLFVGNRTQYRPIVLSIMNGTSKMELEELENFGSLPINGPFVSQVPSVKCNWQLWVSESKTSEVNGLCCSMSRLDRYSPHWQRILKQHNSDLIDDPKNNFFV